jgi:hypothetical protein
MRLSSTTDAQKNPNNYKRFTSIIKNITNLLFGALSVTFPNSRVQRSCSLLLFFILVVSFINIRIYVIFRQSPFLLLFCLQGC